MYEEFFGLQRRPFSATPDANCFIPLESHQGALDALAVSCERGQGIGVLTGEAGLGKSLVGLRLAFEMQPTFATAFLGHSAYATRRALLQAILFELNRPYDRKAEQELRLDLAAALRSLRSEKQGFVLIVDEAHRLSLPLLDEIRLLTLLSSDGEPLVRAVLLGDRNLEERLADPELAAFNQRVCCQVDLSPLSQAESLEYLSSNLEFAGADVEEIFNEDALTFLAKAADGVPRCLNHLADHSLLLAYVTERRPITVEVVREALDDLKQLPLHWNDPISGGEIYRGLSQSPTMEDSAVDLWPQREQKNDDEPRETNSWDESAFAGSSAAIEIGGELDEPANESEPQQAVETEPLSCLKSDWQAITRSSPSVEELLANVEALTQTIEESQDPPTLGQVFDAQDFEFGAPSPQSFAVEEFADEDEFGDDRLESSFDDEAASEQWSSAADNNAQPVWNLPQRSWSESDDAEVEFEEEPVVDRYVRIETPVSGAATNWSRVARPSRAVTAVKTTKLVMTATSGAPDESEDSPPVSRGADSGIVESYSRKSRTVGHVSNVPVQSPTQRAEDEAGHVESVPHEKRDWHLPTELLQATLADDGIEEQLGADVLDMYLDVQQSLIEQRMVSGRSAESAVKSKAVEVEESKIDDDYSEPSRETQSGTIQRAYGRLFSELRRKKR